VPFGVVFLLDESEFVRWMGQAKHNLESAERDAKEGDFSWACFKAHQAAKLAVKALLLGLGQPAQGHSVLALLRQVSDLQIEIPRQLLESAQRLDRLYIPTRYPTAHPTGSPFEFYNEADAQQALSDARQVIDLQDKPSTTPKWLQERRKRWAELRALANKLADKAKEAFGKVSVWLYVSVARGDFNFWSDVDVLLVAEAPFRAVGLASQISAAGR